MLLGVLGLQCMTVARLRMQLGGCVYAWEDGYQPGPNQAELGLCEYDGGHIGDPHVTLMDLHRRQGLSGRPGPPKHSHTSEEIHIPPRLSETDMQFR